MQLFEHMIGWGEALNLADPSVATHISEAFYALTDEEGKIFYIYVCTNGNLATGKYWPTYRNDLLARGEYDWGTDGRYYPAQ